MSKSIEDIDEVEDTYGDEATVQVWKNQVYLTSWSGGDETCLIFNEDQVNRLIIALDKAKKAFA